MDSTSETPYFQFPLRYVTDRKKAPDDKLYSQLRGQCVSYAAWLWIRKCSDDDIRNGAFRFQSNHKEKLPAIQQLLKEGRYGIYLAAAHYLQFQWGALSADYFDRERNEMETVHEKARQQGGWNVRIRSDIFWDMVNHEWQPLKIRVLCAVYAIIGSDAYKRITHQLVCALVSGYDSPRKAAGEKLVPESTVRYWLDELHQRNLFRVCIHGNHRFYAIANFKDDAELAAYVLQHHAKRTKKRLVRTSDLITPPPSSAS